MVHPSEILRTNSNAQRFAAPLRTVVDEVDCGFRWFPWFSKWLKLERMAKIGVFMVVLCISGFVHGGIISYIRSTSQLWGEHYNFPMVLLDWFIFFNEIFSGMFAMAIAYWGNRIHRPLWMGGTGWLVAGSCLIVAIPELINPYQHSEITNIISGPSLCNATISDVPTSYSNMEDQWVSLMLLILFQIFFGMSTVSLIAHGITYIDDHTSINYTPGYIAVFLAIKEIGKQIGTYCAWIPYFYTKRGIFTCPAWVTGIALMSGIASTIALFPKELPNLVMMRSVNSLVAMATGQVVEADRKPRHRGFLYDCWQVLSNRLLLINISSLILIQSAVVNFGLLEKYFNQAKYHVALSKDTTGYTDPNIIQMTTNLLRQPMVAVSILASGVIMSKFRPRIRSTLAWNVIASIMMALIFGSSAFWNCAGKIYNENDRSIAIPSCSQRCQCLGNEPFVPVCIDGVTFFSPCMAGCQNYSSITHIYSNCKCGKNVVEGSCFKDKCALILAVSQANNIIVHGLLASTLVPNLIINMRLVAEEERVLAIGTQLMLSGLVPYVPVKVVYRLFSATFCIVRGKAGCLYYSDNFTIFLSMATIILMTAAAVVALGLIFIIPEIELYEATGDSSPNLVLRSIKPIYEEPIYENPSEVKKKEEDPFLAEPNRPAPVLPYSLQRRKSGLRSLRKKQMELRRELPSTSKQRSDESTSTKSELSLNDIAVFAACDNDSLTSTDISEYKTPRPQKISVQIHFEENRSDDNEEKEAIEMKEFRVENVEKVTNEPQALDEPQAPVEPQAPAKPQVPVEPQAPVVLNLSILPQINETDV